MKKSISYVEKLAELKLKQAKAREELCKEIKEVVGFVFMILPLGILIAGLAWVTADLVNTMYQDHKYIQILKQSCHIILVN
jgi:hypothetical protein